MMLRMSALALIVSLMPVHAQEAVSIGSGAILRGLDKVNGEVADLEMVSGQEAMLGNLLLRLEECRYPEGNPAGDAYAFVEVRDVNAGTSPPVFEGWMVASSPALNALDHARYDVWVLRCKTS